MTAFVVNCPFTTVLTTFSNRFTELDLKITYDESVFDQTGMATVTQKVIGDDAAYLVYVDTSLPVSKIQHALILCLSNIAVEANETELSDDEKIDLHDEIVMWLHDSWENITRSNDVDNLH